MSDVLDKELNELTRSGIALGRLLATQKMPVILQLMIVVVTESGRKTLIKNSPTPYKVPVECTPTGDKESWADDIRKATANELCGQPELGGLAKGIVNCTIREYTRGRTNIAVFKAVSITEDIGIHPERAQDFVWVTAEEIHKIEGPFEPADKMTLLWALSP